MKAVVIGSGMAGLTAAATLAQAGHEVAVFEQDKHIGGVTAPYKQDGYCWDLGQLLIEGLGPDEPVGKILAELGVLERIRVRKDDREYIFPDFAIHKPDTYSGFLWRIDILKKQFPAESRGLDRYWQDYLRFTRVMTCARRSEEARGLVRKMWQARLYWNLLPFLPRKDWSAKRLMDSYFKDERLKAVFTSILADFFTPPSHFPGLGVFALNPEPSFDCRMPKMAGEDAEQLYHYSVLGGISTLVAALAARIQENGGQILTGCAIASISVEVGRAKGVTDAAGRFTPADVVIASGGAKETFFNLIGKAHLTANLQETVRRLPLMDSVFMVHLGVEMDPAPYVPGVCSYFYGTYDLEGGITRARMGHYHEGEEGFVIHVPTRHSPEMAPPGCHALTIYTICPDSLLNGDWESRKEAYADRLVECAERHIPGLRASTSTRAILTPEDFRQRTHLSHHAFGGIAPVMGAARVTHQTPIKGLWFIGAQSESGGGINNVIPGAYKVAKKIAAS